MLPTGMSITVEKPIATLGRQRRAEYGAKMSCKESERRWPFQAIFADAV